MYGKFSYCSLLILMVDYGIEKEFSPLIGTGYFHSTSGLVFDVSLVLFVGIIGLTLLFLEI